MRKLLMALNALLQMLVVVVISPLAFLRNGISDTAIQEYVLKMLDVNDGSLAAERLKREVLVEFPGLTDEQYEKVLKSLQFHRMITKVSSLKIRDGHRYVYTITDKGKKELYTLS